MSGNNFIDLTGKQFGRLTVLERDYEYPITHNLKDKTRVYWKCQCACDKKTIKSIDGASLKGGRTRSCGCLSREISKNLGTKTAKDLTNQRFGKLTAIYPTDKRVNSKVIWYCECECGNSCLAASSNLLSGNTQSCGCLKKETLFGSNINQPPRVDLRGQRFGKLVAIEPTNERTNGQSVIWLCKCDCGNWHKASAASLRQGSVKSCGCLTSIGEYSIQKILQDNNIQFEKQKFFEDFVFPETKAHPKYDFYLPKYNRLIEFDGIQHFEPVEIFGGQEYLELIQKHDKLKNEYALKNNISLVRIPYIFKNKITLDLILSDKFLIK